MNPNAQLLKDWFNHLPRSDQEEVLSLVYGSGLVRRGDYYGPDPKEFAPFFHIGPAPKEPIADAGVGGGSGLKCPHCGKDVTISLG